MSSTDDKSLRWVRTTLLSKDAAAYLDAAGLEFATVEDAGQAVARIVSTPDINGKQKQSSCQ